MFTGLVAAKGTVERSSGTAGAPACAFAPSWLPSWPRGDSIAVNGVCLTARDPDATGFGADVMPRRSSAARSGR